MRWYHLRLVLSTGIWLMLMTGLALAQCPYSPSTAPTTPVATYPSVELPMSLPDAAAPTCGAGCAQSECANCGAVAAGKDCSCNSMAKASAGGGMGCKMMGGGMGGGMMMGQPMAAPTCGAGCAQSECANCGAVAAGKDCSCNSMAKTSTSGGMGCKMMAGGMMAGTGIAQTRRISGAQVLLQVAPQALVAGKTTLKVHLTDESGVDVQSVKLNFFLYPAGQPELGKRLWPVTAAKPGPFAVVSELSKAGIWELALRVMRPGQPDELVWFQIPVG